MWTMSQIEDVGTALRIAQAERDKWKKRAQKLAKIMGIRDCDIDDLMVPEEKAIKAMQTEPCEDCISRQAAIEQSIVLRDISNPDKEWEVVTVATIKHLKPVQPKIKCIAKITMTDEQVKEAFEKAKCEILATQPEQKVGHWVITDYEYYDCSVCGESYYNGCESRKEAEERLKMRPYDVYSFCPHCGAKMEEGE